MRRPTRTLATLALTVAAACGGGTGAASTASPAATSAAPTVAAASPTAAPSASPSASPAPAFAGVGSASAKLSETKMTATGASTHIGFLGDEALAAGPYTETLNVVTLQPGGRTVSHKHGGIEWVIVIDGSVEIRMAAGGRAMLTAGQTAKVPANTPLQALNVGPGVAKFLAFFVTADGQPFQTNLEPVPSGPDPGIGLPRPMPGSPFR